VTCDKGRLRTSLKRFCHSIATTERAHRFLHSIPVSDREIRVDLGYVLYEKPSWKFCRITEFINSYRISNVNDCHIWAFHFCIDSISLLLLMASLFPELGSALNRLRFIFSFRRVIFAELISHFFYHCFELLISCISLLCLRQRSLIMVQYYVDHEAGTTDWFCDGGPNWDEVNYTHVC
jgi:hypothetical protein